MSPAAPTRYGRRLVARALLGLAVAPAWSWQAAARAGRLAPSGPVEIRADGEVIERLHIRTSDGPGVAGRDRRGIVVRDCVIEHAEGAHGIALDRCPGALVENCDLRVVNAPPAGPLAAETNAVQVWRSPESRIRRVRARDASAVVYVVESPRCRVSMIEGYDQRGPLPRGNLVQFNRADRSLLEDFYARNDLRVARTQDNVSVFESNGCTIRRGLIDGSNGPTGSGVIFERSSDGVCEDVDVVRFSNCAFAAYPGRNIVFRRVRARESFRPTPDGEPASRSIMFAVSPRSEAISIEAASYFALVNDGNLVWDRSRVVALELFRLDFPPRPGLRLEGLPCAA